MQIYNPQSTNCVYIFFTLQDTPTAKQLLLHGLLQLSNYHFSLIYKTKSSHLWLPGVSILGSGSAPGMRQSTTGCCAFAPRREESPRRGTRGFEQPDTAHRAGRKPPRRIPACQLVSPKTARTGRPRAYIMRSPNLADTFMSVEHQ